MPAPVGRDLGLTRKQLGEWLPGALGGVEALEVGELTGPGSTGFSSDTLIFDVHYREGGEARSQGLVVRIKPTGFQLFPEYDLGMQYRIMDALGPTPVAVPRMICEETRGDVIGAPFYVMERVEGRIPGDNPPYNAEGWVTELSSEQRAELWRSYVEGLVAIHAADPQALGLGGLAMPELGATPLEQELAYYERFATWAYGDRAHPVVAPGLAWLKANRPAGPEPVGLCWGDARVGNMIFAAERCVAVIDWEMARIASPMLDLAWGLFLDRYHTEGVGVPRLPGFPDREGTVALYRELSGRTTEHLEYYEVLAGLRFSVILVRLGRQFKHYGALPEDATFEVDNPVCNLHRKQLEALGAL